MSGLSRDSANARVLRTDVDRRSVVKTMLFAGGALAFSGFGHSSRAVAQDNIRLVHWYHQYGEEGTEAAVQQYAEQYTAENPNVEIEVVWQLGDYGQALNAALLTDEAPDIFEQNAVTLDQVRQGQVAPLDDLYTEEVRAGFNEISLRAATLEGSIYWVKMLDDTGCIYYRKSVLEEAGVEPPESLDALIEAAQALNTGARRASSSATTVASAPWAGRSCGRQAGTSSPRTARHLHSTPSEPQPPSPSTGISSSPTRS
jgi:multiple sugar transport system substrate-binding protein